MNINKDKVKRSNEENIHFHVGDNEVLRLEPNGDIYVHGRLADNDKLVVDGLREFIIESRKDKLK